MTSVNYTQLFVGSAMPNWLAPTITAIKNQANEGGLLGMLDSAGGDGSIGSFLSKSSATAGSFAAISQNSVTNASSLVAQIASQNIQDANSKKLQDALASLSATQQMVQAKNVLDPFIYFQDGSNIDTNSNILTMANGAYLNTATNILTMADGTQIDTVTGLTVSVTA